MGLKKIILGMAIALLCGSLFGFARSTDIEADFISANALYSAGDYEGALQAYLNLEKRLSVPSFGLYFNIGNTYFKLGDYPRALVYYLRARRFYPFNRELQYNIRITHKQLEIKDELPWFSFVWMIPTYKWALVITTVFWAILFIGFLPISQIKKTFFVSIMIFLLMFSVLGFLYSYIMGSANFYVVLHKSRLFSGPSYKESEIAILKPGVDVVELKTLGEWIKVKAHNITGWINRKDVEKI